MKPGDVCVQRGTIHGWTNNTDKPARIYFILSGKSFLLEEWAMRMVRHAYDHIAAKPVEVNGQSLTAVGYSKKDIESGGQSN
jgi:hypothetical protein